MHQLEIRLSVAENGRFAAERQVNVLRQQLCTEQQTNKSRESHLLQQLAQQESILAAAAVHLGPLESQANPVSPLATPRVRQQHHAQEQVDP